jgi:hypothetical protein
MKTRFLRLVFVAKRDFYRKEHQVRKGIAKENQREIFATLCDLGALGGGKALSQQQLD